MSRLQFPLGFVGFVILVLIFRSQQHTYGQSFSANIFSLPLGQFDGHTYSPHENTIYGIRNPGFQGLSCFGVDRSTLFHAGVDLYRSDGESAAGSQVLAVANGQVVYGQFLNYPGSVVIIKHDDPFDDPNFPKSIYSVYSHLDTIYVAVGSNVSQGSIIGTVITNTAPGFDDSHLHFEIRYFEDGGNIYTDYPNCNGTTGKAGKGYTYLEHPDNFPTPEMGYTSLNPSD